MRRLLPLIVAVTAGPAAAEVVSSGDAGFVIQHTATATAAPADVWKLLVAPNLWWSGDHTYTGDAANLWLDAQATGCFCEKLPKPKTAPDSQRMGSVEHMHVVYADPAQGVLRMIGGLGPLQQEAVHGVLTINVKPDGDGTRIVWRYAVGGFWQAKPVDLAPIVDKVLGEQVARLAAKAVPTSSGAGATKP
jgi:hypothetical protein